jgi:hypothetical protein
MPFLFSFLLGPNANPPQSPQTGRSVSSAELHLTPEREISICYTTRQVRCGSDLLL